jgi:hypothetical protein
MILEKKEDLSLFLKLSETSKIKVIIIKVTKE